MEEMDIGEMFVNGGQEELEKIIDLYGEKLLRYATAILSFSDRRLPLQGMCRA